VGRLRPSRIGVSPVLLSGPKGRKFAWSTATFPDTQLPLWRFGAQRGAGKMPTLSCRVPSRKSVSISVGGLLYDCFKSNESVQLHGLALFFMASILLLGSIIEFICLP
jgi:hypothetical protein